MKSQLLNRGVFSKDASDIWRVPASRGSLVVGSQKMMLSSPSSWL
nr:MAG TPA: hypothetical protein [Caudoviricetes sp.]